MRISTASRTVIMIISLILFLFLALYRDQLIHIDESIYTWLTAHGSVVIDTIMGGLTHIGSGEMILIIAFILAGFLAFKRLWKDVFFLLTVTFGGIFINLLLKMTIQRGRPEESRDIEVFGYSLDMTSYSFPSGHAMRIFLLAFILIFLCSRFIKTKGWRTLSVSLLLLLPVLVSVSRIMIGAHYFTDIAAAMFIAIFWYQLCYLFFTKIRKFDKGLSFR